jgi:hypothetical protein
MVDFFSLSRRVAAVALTTVLMSSQALTMTLVRVGPALYASGPVTDKDYVQFKDALATGGVQRVVFVNSPGGDLWTGLQIGRMIRDASLETRVSGHCHSACSIMFLGGRDRRFATGHPARATMLGLHGPHNRMSRAIAFEAAPQIYAFYRLQMGERFDSTLINKALYGITDAAGMLRLRETARTKPDDRVPWFCPKGSTPLAECERFPGHDAYTLGLVTDPQTEEIELPQALRATFTFYGVRFTETLTSVSDAGIEEITRTYCDGSELCMVLARRELAAWREREPHRALAIGQGKRGFGWTQRGDTPLNAALRALYLCNHVQKNPKLCRLVAVDEYLVPDLHAQARQQFDVLRPNLPTPPADLVQEECDEAGGSTPSQRRTGDPAGLTPRQIDGVTRWNTDTLALALGTPTPPLLIDVGGMVDSMLPGALHFLHGGLALNDPAAERAFDERFRRMLGAAGAHTDRAVVFYGNDSGNWWAANAAMRARDAGYTEVGWYRGGLAAWLRAGMPVVPKVASAVLN